MPTSDHIIQFAVHRVRASDITITPKVAGDTRGATRWIDIRIADHEITLFADNEAEFEALCKLFQRVPPPPRGVMSVPIDADALGESDEAWDRWRRS